LLGCHSSGPDKDCRYQQAEGEVADVGKKRGRHPRWQGGLSDHDQPGRIGTEFPLPLL
jgi:hypothetical protein